MYFFENRDYSWTVCLKSRLGFPKIHEKSKTNPLQIYQKPVLNRCREKIVEKSVPGRQNGAPRPQNGGQRSPKGAPRDPQIDPVGAQASQRRPRVPQQKLSSPRPFLGQCPTTSPGRPKGTPGHQNAFKIDSKLIQH